MYAVKVFGEELTERWNSPLHWYYKITKWLNHLYISTRVIRPGFFYRSKINGRAVIFSLVSPSKRLWDETRPLACLNILPMKHKWLMELYVGESSSFDYFKGIISIIVVINIIITIILSIILIIIIIIITVNIIIISNMMS